MTYRNKFEIEIKMQKVHSVSKNSAPTLVTIRTKLLIGDFVANGIFAGKFWLFNHPEFGDLVQARSEEVRVSQLAA